MNVDPQLDIKKLAQRYMRENPPSEEAAKPGENTPLNNLINSRPTEPKK